MGALRQGRSLPEAIGLWARRGLAPGALTEVDIWDAFEHREAIAAALRSGARLDAHLEAALAAADDAWHAASHLVAPALRLGTYLQTRPPGHFAHQYLDQA